MDERKKTLAAVTVLVGIIIFIIIIIGVIVSSRNVVSPIPDEQVLRVIFITPTPELEKPVLDATESGILEKNN